MKLYFARHGHNDANTNSTPSQLTGEIDEPLNEIGVKQANELAEQLKDVQFDAIISSPLKRAYQTAEIVNGLHGLPLEINSAWRERETGGIYASLELWSDMFDFDKNIKLNNSESLNDFINRIYSAIEELKQNYHNKSVLVVSHDGVYCALNAYINKLPLSSSIRISPMKNCEYHIYEL